MAIPYPKATYTGRWFIPDDVHGVYHNAGELLLGLKDVWAVVSRPDGDKSSIPLNESDFELIARKFSAMLRSPTPIVSTDANDLYRVMMVYTNGEYRIFVGDDKVRIFSEQGLPEEIRSKLSIIRAAAELYFHPLGEVAHSTDMLFGGYTNDVFPPEFNDIGWQITRPPNVWYCIIIPEKLLDSLRGKET